MSQKPILKLLANKSSFGCQIPDFHETVEPHTYPGLFRALYIVPPALNAYTLPPIYQDFATGMIFAHETKKILKDDLLQLPLCCRGFARLKQVRDKFNALQASMDIYVD